MKSLLILILVCPYLCLASLKFDPYAIYLGEVFSNIDGGIKRSTQWQGVLELGVDLQNKRNEFHFSGLWLSNSNDPSYDLIGNFNQVSNITGNAAVRLYRAHWRYQFNEEVSLKIGQLALDDDFMILESASLFLNANFGPLPTQSANNLSPQYPLGALGIWGGWKLSHSHSMQIGVYDSDTGNQVDNQDGIDFHLSSSEGATIFIESNWKTPEMNYQLGSFFDSGQKNNFRENDFVTSYYGFYGALEYQVNMGTQAFMRIGYNPISDRSINDLYIDLGFVTKGFRDQDMLGIAFLYSRFSEAFIDSSVQFLRYEESAFELTYLLNLYSGLSLQPDVQYILNPIEGASDSLVIGLRVKIEF